MFLCIYQIIFTCHDIATVPLNLILLLILMIVIYVSLEVFHFVLKAARDIKWSHKLTWHGNARLIFFFLIPPPLPHTPLFLPLPWSLFQTLEPSAATTPRCRYYILSPMLSPPFSPLTDVTIAPLNAAKPSSSFGNRCQTIVIVSPHWQVHGLSLLRSLSLSHNKRGGERG